MIRVMWHELRGHVVKAEEKAGRRWWRCAYCQIEWLRGWGS